MIRYREAALLQALSLQGHVSDRLWRFRILYPDTI